MIMPLPAHLRLPSPTAKPVAALAEQQHHHPRSPIKKHLQATAASSGRKPAASTKVGSPQKLKAVVAQNGGATSAGTSTSFESALAEARGGRLRAATLQAVLGLLDRDDEALQQLLPLLHVLASLPLNNDSVRRQCMAMLQELHGDNDVKATATTSGRGATYAEGKTKTAARLPASLRDSGRAKSAVSLQHCKEFLLACANEIHELEEVNPWFDYAEETNSEMAAVLARGSMKPPHRQQPAKKAASAPVHRQGAVFDYESTVGSSSTLHTAADVFSGGDENADEVEDTGASQGSQLSDLLCRAADVENDELSSGYEPRSTLSLADRVAARRVFRLWRGSSASRASSSPVGRDSAVVFRAFAALKHHRAVSKLSLSRKHHVFQSLKSLVKPRSTTSKAVQARTQSSVASRVVVLMHMHWDLVLLLLFACFVQFFMQ